MISQTGKCLETKNRGDDSMPKKSGKPVLSIAIPFYNEEDNAADAITGTINSLRKAGIPFEIIAVDNGSADGTADILESMKSNRVRVLHIKKNRGFGNGIIQGWLAAKGRYLGYTSGDNEIDSSAIASIFNKLVTEGLDLCKGKRVSRGYGFFRKIESYVYNKVVCQLLLGYSYGDINGFPKIMTRECYNAIAPTYKDSFFDTEIMVKAERKGFRIGSVAVEYKKRRKGKSSVPFYIALEFIKNIIKFKIKMLLGKF